MLAARGRRQLRIAQPVQRAARHGGVIGAACVQGGGARVGPGMPRNDHLRTPPPATDHGHRDRRRVQLGEKFLATRNRRFVDRPSNSGRGGGRGPSTKVSARARAPTHSQQTNTGRKTLGPLPPRRCADSCMLHDGAQKTPGRMADADATRRKRASEREATCAARRRAAPSRTACSNRSRRRRAALLLVSRRRGRWAYRVSRRQTWRSAAPPLGCSASTTRRWSALRAGTGRREQAAGGEGRWLAAGAPPPPPPPLL